MLSQAINYFDKTVLGLSASFIMKDLGLTPTQYGLAANSLYSFYALSGVLVGLFVVNHVSGKWHFSLLVLVWTAAQLPILLAPGLMTIIVTRRLLGIGEGPANLTGISLIHGWFTDQQRGIPTATIMVGSTIGSLISAPLLTGSSLDSAGARVSAFAPLSVFAWLLLWLVFGANPPVQAPQSIARESPPTMPDSI